MKRKRERIKKENKQKMKDVAGYKKKCVDGVMGLVLFFFSIQRLQRVAGRDKNKIKKRTKSKGTSAHLLRPKLSSLQPRNAAATMT